MKISKVMAREIFDSRACPTIMCEIHVSNGAVVMASVPSGASRGHNEARELRDGDKRLHGQGVDAAVNIIETIIAPMIIGQEPDVVEIDRIIRGLDGTVNKNNFGANTLLAVSMATCRAQALMHDIQLYELIAELCQAETVSLPFPLVNIINGGVHAANGLPIQEFLLAPMGFQNFREAFEASIEVFYAMKAILKKRGLSISTGDEGGFSPFFKNENEPFELLFEALRNSKLEEHFSIAIDVAANQLYDPETSLYRWYNNDQVSSDYLIEKYKQWNGQYRLFSVEDGCSEFDMQGWKTLSYMLGDQIQLVGDDIFSTHTAAIEKGIKEGIANAVIIKPNQIGTITETLEAIVMCQSNNFNSIVSHRSGETMDTFIADLAVGAGAGQIKAGGLFHGERIEKYNRLLQIEDMLVFSSLDI